MHDGGAAALAALPAGLSVTVRVPATSANLGPGYDSLGLAVQLFDTVTVQTLDTGALEFDLSGEGVDSVPRDGRHLVIRALEQGLARLGYRHQGLKLSAENVIPHGRGLGSSAAAVVAAALAANALVPAEAQRGLAWVLQFTSELEGHPDNVAPAIFGALALSWQEGEEFLSARAEVHPEVTPVVAIPDFELSTELARTLLPAQVDHHQAAMNSGRAALLVAALTGAPELLLPATRDYLHQDYRAEAMRPSAELIGALRAAGHATVVSGAGPTVMTLARDAAEADAVEAFIRNRAQDGVSWRVLRPGVDREGAKVEVHSR
ncbi:MULTISPECIES: homoserine kinase [Arthrobacter]|uniref:Homoserine kinase n=2 Tax=Arthrobacter TaxID=1663 RepID=A0ABU9KNI1_9MICC|nr:homoserine kinase [Arthrobacter sp. YJM1]MDP5228403.1 homoserine kinase [Arthrobacter sp. YJM1]